MIWKCVASTPKFKSTENKSANSFRRIPCKKVLKPEILNEKSQVPSTKKRPIEKESKTPELIRRKSKIPLKLSKNIFPKIKSSVSSSVNSKIDVKQRHIETFFKSKQSSKLNGHKKTLKFQSQFTQTIQMVGIFFHYRGINQFIEKSNLEHLTPDLKIPNRSKNIRKISDLRTIEEVTEKRSSCTGRITNPWYEREPSKKLSRCKSVDYSEELCTNLTNTINEGRCETKSIPTKRPKNILEMSPTRATQSIGEEFFKQKKDTVPINDFDPNSDQPQARKTSPTEKTKLTIHQSKIGFVDEYKQELEQRETLIQIMNKRNKSPNLVCRRKPSEQLLETNLAEKSMQQNSVGRSESSDHLSVISKYFQVLSEQQNSNELNQKKECEKTVENSFNKMIAKTTKLIDRKNDKIAIRNFMNKFGCSKKSAPFKSVLSNEIPKNGNFKPLKSVRLISNTGTIKSRVLKTNIFPRKSGPPLINIYSNKNDFEKDSEDNQGILQKQKVSSVARMAQKSMHDANTKKTIHPDYQILSKNLNSLGSTFLGGLKHKPVLTKASKAPIFRSFGRNFIKKAVNLIYSEKV